MSTRGDGQAGCWKPVRKSRRMRLYRCRLDMRACHPASDFGDRVTYGWGFHAPLPGFHGKRSEANMRGRFRQLGDKDTAGTTQNRARAAQFSTTLDARGTRARKGRGSRPNRLQIGVLKRFQGVLVRCPSLALPRPLDARNPTIKSLNRRSDSQAARMTIGLPSDLLQ